MKRIGPGLRILGVLLVAIVLVSAAFVAGRGSQQTLTGAGVSSLDYGAVAPTAPGDLGGMGATAGKGASVAQEDAARSAATPDADGGGDKLVIRNAGMTLRVDSVDEKLGDVRSLVRRYEGEITEMLLDAPSDGQRPLGEGATGPTTAYVTVRVPAADLDAMTADLEKLGTVVSQSSSASDVTEQFVDLEARLKNLRAEEARLREFLERAGNVKDLLAVQTELSRVRGEIEAMTAQITYLERQAARATLTVTLTEPGPIVSPGGADWGVRQAITDGLRGAVTLVNAAITAVIAISPLLLIGALGWFAFRAVLRRRALQTDTAAETDADSPDGA